MADNLDKWIKDSKVVTPDSGEFRRLNRVLIKDRILAVEPARRRRHRVFMVSVTVVLILLVSGQVTRLGSDSFEMETTTEFRPWRGDSVTIYENVFRGGSVNLPADFSQADIDEYQRSVAAEEGTIVRATGYSYGGKTSWIKHVKREINGRENIEGREPHSPLSQDPDKYMEFLLGHYKDLVGRSRTNPPDGSMRLAVDGVLIEFNFWTFAYPQFGKVTYYDGYPVEGN
jgi:hypothetical protein